MERRALADSDVRVGVIGLGCVYFGYLIGHEETRAVLDAALECGVDYLDLSDLYGTNPGDSEDAVGAAIAGRRDAFVLSTKAGGVGFFEQRGARWGKRDYLTRSLDASLRRLRTDHIDVYGLHFADPSTPIEETLGVLDDFVRQGKVRAIGHSNFSTLDLTEADRAARDASTARFVMAQNRWNLLERDVEHDHEVVAACRRHRVAQVPLRPLASGLLSGKYRAGQPLQAGTRMADLQNVRYHRQMTKKNLRTVAALDEFASARGHDLIDLSLSWLLSHECVATVPVGARTAEQVRTNAAAGAWKLSAEELRAIDAIAPVEAPDPVVIKRRSV
jgi:aryl-alcohol dehydrogenase-like predicted oxidoreductase